MARDVQGRELSVTATSSDFGAALLHVEDAGWIEVFSQDCMVLWRCAESFDRSERVEFRRTGPAGSRALFRVERGASVQWRVPQILSTTRCDPHTGLVSTATAAPLVAARCYRERPPVVQAQVGLIASGTARADRAAIDSATPLLCYPPGYATRLHLAASSAVVLDLLDTTPVATLPASREHVLHTVDPWLCVSASVAASSANAVAAWGVDR